MTIDRIRETSRDPRLSCSSSSAINSGSSNNNNKDLIFKIWPSQVTPPLAMYYQERPLPISDLKQEVPQYDPSYRLPLIREAVLCLGLQAFREKLKSLKSAQPPSDDSTPHQVAARNDTYTQVLGPDRPGLVSGVGTGPTPTSMWGNESKEALRTENRLLMQRMEELETTMAEKFAKMESMIRGSQVYI
ncbi:hypothetical protein Taro_047227 [Colocasia esculenta]|uniref:Uncharacterized protein n=1 Tax=Colocasia esculenta TaxID=4460 RepID=A0A843X0K6_COLES|nr:hypothetical protein [Colocasia esculenta]